MAECAARPLRGGILPRSCMVAALGALALATPALAGAQTLLSQVKLIANPSVAAATVPTAQTFTITQAGSYTVTLTDLQTPLPLASLQLAVASATATAVQLSTTTTTSTASQSVTLQPGAYTEQVLASAAANSLGGSFSVQVTDSTGAAVPVTPVGGTSSSSAFVGAVGPPATSTSSASVLQTQFTVSSAGTYQLTLTDLGFPAALLQGSVDIALWNLNAPTTLLIDQTGQTISPTGSAFQPSAALSAGTYDLIVIAQAGQGAQGGLYTATVSGASGTAYASAVAVGNLVPVQFTISAPQNLTLTVADLGSPSPLGSLQTILVEGGAVLQPASPAGTYPITAAPAGTAQLFVSAQPGAAGEGSYSAVVQGSSQTLLDIAQPVTDSSHYGFGYSGTVSSTGAYELELSDFQIPHALSSLSAVVEQGGAPLASTTLAAGGTATLSPQPQTGPINIVAFAAPASGGGLFGVQLAAGTSGPIAYQTTQGVGTGFSSDTVSVPSSGTYSVQLTDLGFPASFSQLDLIVSSGLKMLGQIDGSGSVSLSATPGTYTLNVLAQTGTAEGGGAANYGLYGVQMAAQPPPSTTPAGGSSSSTGGGGAISPILLLLLSSTLAYRLIARRRAAGRAQ